MSRLPDREPAHLIEAVAIATVVFLAPVLTVAALAFVVVQGVIAR